MFTQELGLLFILHFLSNDCRRMLLAW